MNAGARALQRTGLSCAAIGRRVGRTRACVALWRSGARRPDAAARLALHRMLGIALEAWDVPSSTTVDANGVRVST